MSDVVRFRAMCRYPAQVFGQLPIHRVAAADAAVDERGELEQRAVEHIGGVTADEELADLDPSTSAGAPLERGRQIAALALQSCAQPDLAEHRPAVRACEAVEVLEMRVANLGCLTAVDEAVLRIGLHREV
jgi:hypothetical protein